MAKYIVQQLAADEVIITESSLHWVHGLTWAGLFSLFIIPLLQQYATAYAITNKRLIVKTGIFAVREVTMALRRIEAVKMEVSLMGRLLGYGHLTVVGCGGTRENFRYIKRPLVFKKAFLSVKHR